MPVLQPRKEYGGDVCQPEKVLRQRRAVVVGTVAAAVETAAAAVAAAAVAAVKKAAMACTMILSFAATLHAG